MAGTIMMLGFEGLEPQAAYASGPGKFFAGKLSGTGFEGWQIGLGMAYNRLQGSLSNPAAPDDPASHYFLVGNVVGKKLTGQLYAPGDTTLTQQLGTVTGSLKGTKLTGTFALTAGGTGSFAGSQLKADTKAMSKMAGTYDGYVERGAPGFKAQVVVGKNGTFSVSSVKNADDSAVSARFSGVFIIPPGTGSAGAKTILTMFLPTGLQPRGGDTGTLLDCPCCEKSISEEFNDNYRKILTGGSDSYSTGASVSVSAGPYYVNGLKRK